MTWFNPRTGDLIADGPVKNVTSGSAVLLGQPPADPQEYWLAMVRK